MPEPNPQPNEDVIMDSSDSVLVVIDGPGDTTVRPWPPHLQHYSPRGKPSQQSPPQAPGKSDGPSV